MSDHLQGAQTHGRTDARTHGRTDARTCGPAGSRGALAAAALVLALGAAGCTTLDKAVGKVPWFTTMRDQPAIRPFELPRVPPAGSVPVTGREDSLDLLLDLRDVVNPLPPDSAALARGKLVFDQYCIVCHGPAGHGDGTVVAKFVPPPDLTLDPTKQRSDGYIYAMIRQGRGIMPRYGDKIRGLDRWAVVDYVRQLQGLVTPAEVGTERAPIGPDGRPVEEIPRLMRRRGGRPGGVR